MSEEKKENRRQFLTKGLMGGGLFASAVILIKHGFDFIFPSQAEAKKRKLLVGKADELEVGKAKEVTYGGNDLFLVRNEDGFKVFSAICTHLGCKIKWEEHRNRFYCPCHKGVFSPTGEVISGPPPRPLDEYQVEIEGNLIYMWMKESNRGLS